MRARPELVSPSRSTSVTGARASRSRCSGLERALSPSNHREEREEMHDVYYKEATARPASSQSACAPSGRACVCVPAPSAARPRRLTPSRTSTCSGAPAGMRESQCFEPGWSPAGGRKGRRSTHLRLGRRARRRAGPGRARARLHDGGGSLPAGGLYEGVSEGNEESAQESERTVKALLRRWVLPRTASGTACARKMSTSVDE